MERPETTTVGTEKTDPYRLAGVDTKKGERLVDWLKNEKRSANNEKYGQVFSGIGGFAALFRPNFSMFADPLLISCTDGVGTKLLLGIENQEISNLGLDLVAMCVNDLYTLGGIPLFFLDYFASGSLSSEQFKQVLKGIHEGLSQCDAALVGGETAELPGLYQKNHFDLSGFMVGVVDGANKWGPEKVKEGDILIGLESSGFHSNGYSLIRSWLKKSPCEKGLIKKLLRPTRIYQEVLQAKSQAPDGAIHACAHITGGGLSENLPRIIPNKLVAKIEKRQIPTPAWMKDFILANAEKLETMYPVFNMGLGMILAVEASWYKNVLEIFNELGAPAHKLGEVCTRKRQGPDLIYV